MKKLIFQNRTKLSLRGVLRSRPTKQSQPFKFLVPNETNSE